MAEKEKKNGGGDPKETPPSPRKVVRELQAQEAKDILAKLQPQISKLDVYRQRDKLGSMAFVKRVLWGDVQDVGLEDYLEEHFGGGHFRIKIVQGKDELGKLDVEIEGEPKNRAISTGNLWGQGGGEKKKEEEDTMNLDMYKGMAERAEEARLKAEETRMRMLEDMAKTRMEHEKALSEQRMAAERQMAELKATQERQITELKATLDRTEAARKETAMEGRLETMMRQQEERWRTQFEGVNKVLEKLAEQPHAVPGPTIAEKSIEQLFTKIPELVMLFRSQEKKPSTEDIVKEIVGAISKQAEYSQKQTDLLMERMMRLADEGGKRQDPTKSVTDLIGTVLQLSKDFGKMVQEAAGNRPPVDLGGMDLGPPRERGGWGEVVGPILERAAQAVVKAVTHPAAPAPALPPAPREIAAQQGNGRPPGGDMMTPDQRAVAILREMIRERRDPEEVADAVFNGMEGSRFWGVASPIMQAIMMDPGGAFDTFIRPLPELEGDEGQTYATRLRETLVARIREATEPLRAAGAV